MCAGFIRHSAVLKNIQQFAWAEIHQFGERDERRCGCRVNRFSDLIPKAEEAIRKLAELTEWRRWWWFAIRNRNVRGFRICWM